MDAPGVLYHIIDSGIDRKSIFKDNAEKKTQELISRMNDDE